MCFIGRGIVFAMAQRFIGVIPGVTYGFSPTPTGTLRRWMCNRMGRATNAITNEAANFLRISMRLTPF